LRVSEKHKISSVITPLLVQVTQKVGSHVVNPKDSVVKLLGTFKRGAETRAREQQTLNKLIDRINLDRPIMQQEKVDLILFEQTGQGRDVQSSKVRQMLKAVQTNRKVENKRNMRAYFQMIQYLSQRSKGVTPVLPAKQEISVLEVFKKLTESGWIVKLPEFKQILDFVGIDFLRSPRAQDSHLKRFLWQFAEEIGINEADKESLLGPL
jgi:hypothetical protein